MRHKAAQSQHSYENNQYANHHHPRNILSQNRWSIINFILCIALLTRIFSYFDKAINFTARMFFSSCMSGHVSLLYDYVSKSFIEGRRWVWKKNAKMNGENEKNCLKVIKGARVSKVVKGYLNDKLLFANSQFVSVVLWMI